MKVYWHIGPHKTGTTSLQMALGAHAKSWHCGYYYPPASVAGPGHADLAWRFLGIRDRIREPDVLVRTIESAKAKGFKSVVLSSEDFSRGVLLDEPFAGFSEVCERYECELVLTLRPLVDRVQSEFQEAVKQGETYDFSSVSDIVRLCMVRPGLRPDFVSAAISRIGASSVSVVLVDKYRPESLFKAISEIVGEPIDSPERAVANDSMPYIKTAWLNEVNKGVKGVSVMQRRAVVDFAFDAAIRAEPDIGEVPYPPIAPVVADYLNGVWNLQLEFLSDTRKCRLMRLV